MATLIKIYLIIFAVVIQSYLPTLVFAATNLADSNCNPSNTESVGGQLVYKDGILRGIPCDGVIKTLDQTLQVAENVVLIFILPLVGTLFIIMLIIGGILYITSRGNTQQIERAKKTLTAAIIGLIIVTLSYTIVQIFANVIGGGVS